MSQTNVYVFVHPAYLDQICYPQTLNVWESFERCGAIVMYGNDIDSIKPSSSDVLVAYGRLDEHRSVASMFPRNKKWHYVVDESNSTTGPYQKAMSYMRLLDIGNVVVTYQNPGHLQVLLDNGFKYAVMPQTMPSIRPRTQKDIGVLLSGQVSESFYPVRTRAWNALSRGVPKLVYSLKTPGQDISTRQHDVIRGDYYSLLDRCRMGVVCRAGARDRFVAKYIEMGACHVLPVGDCPTYMPGEMKAAMVDVTRMDDRSICAEVERLLLRDVNELEQRTLAYVDAVNRHYASTPNMLRLMQHLRG